MREIDLSDIELSFLISIIQGQLDYENDIYIKRALKKLLKKLQGAK